MGAGCWPDGQSDPPVLAHDYRQLVLGTGQADAYAFAYVVTEWPQRQFIEQHIQVVITQPIHQLRGCLPSLKFIRLDEADGACTVATDGAQHPERVRQSEAIAAPE